MDVLANLGLGFAVALTVQNIAYCFIGVLLGTVIGVLPGIGPVTAIAMVVLGLLLGLVGTDVNSATRRFNFGMTGLADGIEFVALSMAIYGIAEVAYNLEDKRQSSVVSLGVGRVWPSLDDLKYCLG